MLKSLDINDYEYGLDDQKTLFKMADEISQYVC